MRRALSLVALAVSLAACTTYHDQLGRGQHAFDQTDYERSITILRDLERDLTRLPTNEQAQYAYLRGMSNYRMGFRVEAYHWLAVAKAFDDEAPGTISPDWKARTEKALAEMAPVVAKDGLGSLAAMSKPGDDEPAEGATDAAAAAQKTKKSSKKDDDASGTDDEAPPPKKPAAKPKPKPKPSDEVAPGTEDDAPKPKPKPKADTKPKPKPKPAPADDDE